jgi:hypothetical protein
MAEKDQQSATTSSNCNETSPFKSSPMKRIDFAALGRKRSSSIAPRIFNLSQEQDAVSNEHFEGSDARNTKELQQRNDDLAVQMDAQRLQLISPPPEETLSLRRNSGLVSNLRRGPLSRYWGRIEHYDSCSESVHNLYQWKPRRQRRRMQLWPGP